MNRHTIIVIVSCVVIASTIGYSILNLLNVSSLQFRVAGKEEFDLFSLVSGTKLEVCNPSDLPITFNSYEISSIYNGDRLGTFHLEGSQILPKSSISLRGEFDAGDEKTANIMSLFLDSEIQGKDVSRIDAKKLEIVTEMRISLLGIIPYTVSNNYDGSEFFDLMNGKDGSFEC